MEAFDLIVIGGGPGGMIAMACTYKDLGNTVYPRPTLSKTIMEAAHALNGRASICKGR